MKHFLEERTFTIGGHTRAIAAMARDEWEKNRIRRDEEYESMREISELLGEPPPKKEHVSIPSVLSKKKNAVIAAIMKLLDVHVNQGKGPEGKPYLPAHELRRMEFVLQEAIANGIIHGAKYDAEKTVRVFLQIWHDVVGTWRKIHAAIRVEDPGEGFDISAVADPSRDENLTKPTGRGLAIMAMFTETQFLGKGNEVLISQVWEQDSAPEAKDDKNIV